MLVQNTTSTILVALFLMLFRFVLLLFFSYSPILSVYGTRTFTPAVLPFAVRTPYLNAAMFVPQSVSSTNNWPGFWNGETLGWICYIRVDGKTYTLFGNNNLASSYNISAGTILETELTPTRTIQVIQAGPMNVTLTLLSPIDPCDLVRQSLPFTYTAVNFTSTDDHPHDIQFYADVSGEWLYGGGEGQRSEQMMTWSSHNTSSMIYLKWQLEEPLPFQEFKDQASDGTTYHAMALGKDRNISWQTCQDAVCRPEFVRTGRVNNKDDNSTFRQITNDWPVFPISVDLGSVASPSDPVVWAVGYVRDPSINYTLLGQTTYLRPYYTTQYSTIEAALADFIFDYNNSLAQAVALDQQVYNVALNISADGKLYDMLSLATRQVFSSLVITAPESAGGQARIFMKDMGLTRRVTPVENLYAALPMFLHYNASFVKLLLLPLLEQQNSSPNSTFYAAKDIGDGFPVVTQPTFVQEEFVEQSSNMLIIALAHARHSNDTSLLDNYYELFKHWADSLREDRNALFPANQYVLSAKYYRTLDVLATCFRMSIDTGVVTSNSTNLAAKGIFAIQAMAEISNMVGKTDDFLRYNRTASSYMSIWETHALSSGDNPSVLTTLGGEQDDSEWSLPYNLYPQTLLGFNLLNQSLFNKLTVSYGQRIGSTAGDSFAYGLPIDSSNGALGNIAWNAFTAAVFTNDAVRAQLLGALWNYAASNNTGAPFSAMYNVSSGSYINGASSPALGGLFAPFVRSESISAGSGQSGSGGDSVGSHSVNVSAIVGGTVGGVLGLLALVGSMLWLLRRRKTQRGIGFLDITGTRTEPTPFAPRLPPVLPSEKFWREKGIPASEEIPFLIPRGGEPLLANDGSPSADPDPPTESREEELLRLRSEVDVLQRIVLREQMESPEPYESGVPMTRPPSYTSRGDPLAVGRLNLNEDRLP
ncbi:hypothetical protein DAEQUDRAFT_338010 [Daedalea quercina L-15889]|uniref:DUF1793-domain-containing protein n=1 Tax=Daedalea quercina L-15889 TaxID=1314783 RepID=A0A165PJD7_9APHY|nr:hypothetical protein DAEQUDRAFT_338010 [Daedalea quercina L-15889]